ncbi:pimeloyl-ACP methyl ester carboxylesterase [Microbacterium resistens]|uniref:Pimeloyl-ACP methyl ester carboxylesterase n=1 Tax=Microbacterium resistens TaxID=156977 RepID=A0ABU1SH40_9MICO|nr:alpha/beta hydrolase [Microbacterium resistens]MDR6868926.1 pimeloyl-ACP methyl ester carboxylesterase [Microbacterium resistens]
MSSATHPTSFPEPTIIAVNGVELEVFEAGRHNAGRPIVLCHGFPDIAYTWRNQVPALVAAGYHVIAPNQRGYGNSSRPAEVVAYDIEHLTGDLVALLDHFGYADATFIGHDWGAFVVWSLTLLHPERVNGVIALSLPYLVRGDVPWLDFMEAVLGSDYYFVHFNRQPGVADAVFDADPARFLNNLYRRNEPLMPPQPGMVLIETARTERPLGDPLLSESELSVYTAAFARSGFTGGINWYRNLNRAWHQLADADPIIHQPALMIYGERDAVARAEHLATFVPNVEEVSLDSGHWIHQERPEETTRAILEWLRAGTAPAAL